MKELKQNIVPI